MLMMSKGVIRCPLPSAGGYFTFVSSGLGPQAGWLALHPYVSLIYSPHAARVGAGDCSITCVSIAMSSMLCNVFYFPPYRLCCLPS